jgi:hypothetical protein
MEPRQSAHSEQSRVTTIYCLAFALAANGMLLWFFHDRSWYAPDEGNYAHVALRLLSGETLNLEVQDIHMGYINFINAGAFALFGLDLVSLRYALVLISLLQVCAVFFLVLSQGYSIAICATFAVTSLGVIQFLNPTAHWYCLFLVFVIGICLKWLPQDRSLRFVTVGFLVGTLTLFRQPSGVMVGMGVLAYLLLEAKGDGRGRDTLLARAVILIMSAALVTYLFHFTDLLGFFLFGVWPLAILFYLLPTARVKNRQMINVLKGLGMGGALAALPLLIYHLANGSIVSWLDDTVSGAIALARMDFLEQALYFRIILAGLQQAVSSSGFPEVLNGIYWFTLPLLSALNGALVLGLMNRSEKAERFGSLPILAVFYAPVSLHFQIPIYLYYTAGLSLAALLLVAPSRRVLSRYSLAASALALSFIAVFFHAAQPASRGMEGILKGRRVTLVPSGLSRCAVWVEPNERDRYREILDLIQTHVPPGDSMLAIPSNAELYFLSERRNPFRFYNTALGIRDEKSLGEVIRVITEQPPKLITYNPKDKYCNAYSERIMEVVKERYEFLGSLSGFDVYRSR